MVGETGRARQGGWAGSCTPSVSCLVLPHEGTVPKSFFLFSEVYVSEEWGEGEREMGRENLKLPAPPDAGLDPTTLRS